MALGEVRTVQLAYRRLTEDAQESRDGRLAPQELGAGSYVFGAVVDGAFVPLIELKAGGVEKKIARHKAAQTLATPETPTGE